MSIFVWRYREAEPNLILCFQYSCSDTGGTLLYCFTAETRICLLQRKPWMQGQRMEKMASLKILYCTGTVWRAEEYIIFQAE